MIVEKHQEHTEKFVLFKFLSININNKIYIGKTNKFYKSSLFGYYKRFENHINDVILINDNLPKNIYKIVENDKIIGYKMIIMKNNIKHNKSFQSINLSLNELLTKGID